MGQSALSIKLRCASWQQLATIYKRDLSRGAIFLKAAQPPELGTAIRIDLTLPSSSVIVLTGVVEHHVSDPERGIGVEIKLAPIAAGSMWLIESALASEQKRAPTPATGVPQQPMPAQKSAPTVSVTDGREIASAELELVKALTAEVESLRKLNPFLVLGVGYEATDADVRSAFGELTKRYHPDRFARYEAAELRQVAAEIFILIRDAYRKIGDADARAQTLTTLGRTPAPRAIPAPRAQTNPIVPPPRATTEKPVPAAAPRAVTDAKSGPVAAPRAITDAKSGPVAAPRAIADAKSGPVVAIPAVRPPTTPPVTKPQDPPPPVAPSRPPTAPPVVADGDPHGLDALLDGGKVDEALAQYRVLSKKQPNERAFRAGIELCEGLKALAARDRLEAAQRFEAALEIDPSNERAARELADMRRQATNERKGLLTRLMGKKEP